MPSSSNMPATRPRWSKTWLRYIGWLGMTISSGDEQIVKGLQRNTKMAVALKPRCEENRVIMGLYHLPSTQPAWTRRESGGAHENPETIIRPTALDLST